MIRGRWQPVLALVGGALLVIAAHYPRAGFAQERTSVLVRVILASSEGQGMDPAIGDLYRQLSSMFGYSSYRLMEERQMSLATGERGLVRLPAGPVQEEERRGLPRPQPFQRVPALKEKAPGRALTYRGFEVVPVGRLGDQVEMRVRMEEDGRRLLNTHFRIANGGTVLVGGPPYGSGVLIIAVTASMP